MLKNLRESIGACLQLLGARLLGDTAPPDDAPDQPDTSPWNTLPGGVISLADTGFEIRHTPKSEGAAFTLVSPEGRTMFTAGPGYLAALKKAAEQVAAERAEFELRQVADGPEHATAYLLARIKARP